MLYVYDKLSIFYYLYNISKLYYINFENSLCVYVCDSIEKNR